MEDFYSILDIPQNAAQADIKASYKRLARKYHPDNRETGNEELFKQVSEAYSVLSDNQKRAYYDRVGHAAFVGAVSGGSHGHAGFSDDDVFEHFEQIFESFFGNSGRRSGKKSGKSKGSDLQSVLEIDFLEAAFGINKKVKINRLITCAACNGQGTDSNHPPKTCKTCHGTGEAKKVMRSFIGTITQIMPCPDCNGKGYIITHFCKACQGKGQVSKLEELEVKIPAGVDDGMHLLWNGMGNHAHGGGVPGDLHLLIKVKPHPVFKRHGLDIWQDLEIDVWQAILGDELSLETIHGPQVLKISSGIQPDTVISLNGQGIRLDSGKSGDHHFKVKVLIPNRKELDKRLLDFMEDYQKNKKTLGETDSFFDKFFGRAPN